MTELIRDLLKLGGAIILRNEWGTTELKGGDFTLRESKDWLTIYHESCENPESRSHLHLRRNSYSFAQIIETPAYTPQMAFWKNEQKHEAIGEASKPSFAIYFPSFYDWSNGEKKALQKNQDQYFNWIKVKPSQYKFSE